jgi:hypothetical protein
MRNSNNYIETYTGKKFYVLDPHVDDISLVDIAHALSMSCRYTGHCREFYSVAEHSVHVSNMLEAAEYDKEICMWGLLHDASEAYLADIASPVKPHLSNYKQLEKSVMEEICKKFSLPIDMPEVVHYYDMEMLRVEAQALMPSKGLDWQINKERLNPVTSWKLNCYTPQQAKLAFLERFHILAY